MTITKKIVNGKYRGGVLPRFIGSKFLIFEQTIYGYTDHFVEDYSGGFWQFYELTNGGFYMSLDSEKELTFENDDNYFSESVDADTMSIIINLYVYNHLSFKYYESDVESAERFIRLYSLLLEYAKQHQQASTIFRAID